MYRKMEATEVEGGLRLLPGEEIELAFRFDSGRKVFKSLRDDNCLYFTNKRVIRLELATYRIAPYKDIIYYRVGQHGGDLMNPGVTINLPGESATSRFELRMEEKYLIDVEHLLARHVFKDC